MKTAILLAAVAALAAPLAAHAGETRAPASQTKREGFEEAERLNAAVVAANTEAAVREVREQAAWRAEEAAKQRDYAMVLARYLAAQREYMNAHPEALAAGTQSASR